MNKWECQRRGCQSSAIGVGEAINLVAIGWTVAAHTGGMCVIFCPAHGRMIPCVDSSSPDYRGQSCALCHAESLARRAKLALAVLAETQ